MNSTTTDSNAIPIAADHDSRNLAVIYGSLGTLIAFASLIFAILSWMRSRRQRSATHHASDDLELGLNPSPLRGTICTTQESQSSQSISHKYISTNEEKLLLSMLTSHSGHRQTTSALPAIDVTQPQPLLELEGDATMPPRAHTGRRAVETNNTMDLPCSAAIASQRT